MVLYKRRYTCTYVRTRVPLVRVPWYYHGTNTRVRTMVRVPWYHGTRVPLVPNNGTSGTPACTMWYVPWHIPLRMLVLTICFLINVLICAGRVHPHGRQAHQHSMTRLDLAVNKLNGTSPFAHVAWSGQTSLPRAFKTYSLALAGSIPTSSST